MKASRQRNVSGAPDDHDVERYFDPAGDWVAAPASWDATPDPITQDGIRKALERALKELPPRAARMLMLRETKRWDVERIGAELKLPAAHCRATLHAARLQVCRHLDVHWFGARTRMAATQ